MQSKPVLLTLLAMSVAVIMASGLVWAQPGVKVIEQEAAQIGVEAYICPVYAP
jgi:hypothetical protein